MVINLSICLVKAWNPRFEARARAERLSHCRIGGLAKKNPQIFKYHANPKQFSGGKAKHQYSASVEDQEMMHCFLETQVMGVELRNTT
jgi:hypothetical protein